MYLKNIAINNIGPIDELSIEMPFNENGNPTPIIFVGENGTGKTILQSQIVDGVYEIANKLFDDILPRQGIGYKYYKISGGINIQAGKEKGFSALIFHDDSANKYEYFDKTGDVKKEDFTEPLSEFALSPNNKNDNQKEITSINENQKEKLQQEFVAGAYFYQPAYRYEEPFWKGTSFFDDPRFQENERFFGKFGKEIEVISSSKHNKSFLLDLVLDFHNIQNIKVKTTWRQINSILQQIKKRTDIRFGIGPRGRYRVSIVEQNPDGSAKKQLLPSIDNLSLGESILLNLFINIIRHSDDVPKDFNETKGIVLIDEVDVHLHTDLQKLVLPNLIKLFPKIQFIITTHSPLFLIGMENSFGEKNFEIREMPSGEIITTERFSEFEKAYEALKNTERFVRDVKNKVEESTKNIVFVEGDYDIRYLKKAASVLGKENILNGIQIFDGNGFGGLKNIWKNYNTKLSEVVPQKILLLFDFDTNTSNSDKGKVYKRIVPTIPNSPITKGIENLFSETTLKNAIQYKQAFIDITQKITKTVRGEQVIEPEKWEVNLDEKGNLCDYLCKQGDPNDFKEFSRVFSLIEETFS